ncbi:MAG: hypothetical protein DCF16_11570 [Alphaproteobacteria bacterium]|nr:MAG: hypothetical protein DCF16_11570 [Alphaproteobacteria bacterium]
MSRILVVDDKEENQYYLSALLVGHGHIVELAVNGEAALVSARKARPDLVISDLLMPVMDGFTLLRNWKLDETLRSVPFIVYTATYTAPEDERLALDLGADAFLVKPSEPEDFMLRVQGVLEASARQSPRSPRFAPNEDDSIVRQYSTALVRKLEEKTEELKRANSALQEVAATRNAILNALPAHTALLDADGVIVSVNTAWKSFADKAGLQSGQFQEGENYLAICDAASGPLAADMRAVAAGVRSVLRGERQSYSIEYSSPAPDSKEWFRLSVTPMGDGHAGGVVVTHVNISDTKRAEERSRKAAERLSLALKAASIGIWEWSAHGPMLWDERMHDIYGVGRAETVTYELWASMVHPDDAEPQAAGLARLEKTGQSAREFRIRAGDGAERHIYSVEKASFGADGRINNIIGINVDLTDLREREAQLKASNSRLQTLINQARVGILVHQNFVPVMANDELARIFGYPDKHAVMALRDCRVLFPEEEHARIRDYNEARLSGYNAPGFYAIKGLRLDNTQVELENRAFPIEWGGKMSVCSMFTDVTDQRQLEAQVRQSQRLEAIGQMTGGIAHDFNNLLTIILGNSELLEAGLEGQPKLQAIAQMSIRAADRGAELAHRLLAFARRQTLEPHAVDIDALVSGMDGLLRSAVGGKVEVSIKCDPSLWQAHIDAAQLESALLNLCVNARDAMPDGGWLTIEASNQVLDAAYVANNVPGLEAGEFVMIAVSDTGTGMDERTRLHAFDPFFTTKDVGKGSGLGLSMVYGFAKQSKGHVRIYSEPGEGTVVRLYLPRAGAEALGPALVEERASFVGGSERVLVVEDDEMVRSQVCEQLNALGYEVTSVVDGVDALELLRQDSNFDLLITDIVMPRGLNGRELADEVLKRYPHLAILFTSGYTEDAMERREGDELLAPLLSKPYRRQELAAKVRAVLAGSQSSPARQSSSKMS